MLSALSPQILHSSTTGEDAPSALDLHDLQFMGVTSQHRVWQMQAQG